ncbi:MAG TPA: type VI secretion protein IcmF/TssM N-terminal domain-containing protein [Kofleriaceae bacterium]|nr:type VI secretion protein IcmF/TssM N-terminal domain-containing protein [Kofleriaceae bacterium]
MADIPWTAWIVVAIVLVLLVIAIWLFVRWRRRRDASPRAAGQPSLANQIATAWTRFYRDLPPRARHFPTVIVMGDAGSGKSHLIDARVDWRSQANQFFPSAVDNPVLQLYLGSSVVVHELSAPLLRDISRGTRRALARLWRYMGPSATVVVVVDARALSTTPSETLRELGQLVRGKIRAFPARCRSAVQVRVCLSHMDQIEGYDDFAAVVGAQHGAIDVGPLTERLVDAGALLAATKAVMASYDVNLAYGLTHRKSDAFTRLVGFSGAFPVLLTQLQPLLRSLTGEDPDQPRYRPSGLSLSSLVPESHVCDPFVVDRDLVASSIARQRRFHRRLSLAVAAAGVLSVGLLLWGHEARVAAAEQAISDYTTLVKSGPGSGDSQVRQVSGKLAWMHRSERLWLGHTFLERKHTLEAKLGKTLRDRYLLPLLKVQRINRSTMLYAVALLYASEDNGLRALIRDEIALWVSKLDIPTAVVSAYLDVSEQQYPVAEPFDPEYTGSQWQSYVFDQIKPLYEQPQRLTQAQLDKLKENPPTLYDEREYGVRKKIVELLSAQLALATHPPITKLLESPLGDSEWVEANVVALRAISQAMANNRLAPASPSTLGELGADLERLLSVPSSGKEVYRFSRDKNGHAEDFEFDVAVWKHKLAAASAALTITGVRAHNLEQPEHEIGFFAPGTVLRGVGGGAVVQGPAVELPGMYTAAVFARYVAPALDFITSRAPKLRLSEDEQAALAELYTEQITKYAESYARALRSYYDSFRFDGGSEEALPFSLSGLVQPSSWFVRFLSTVSTNATPALGDGRYYDVMAEHLVDFRPLAELLTPAKGTIPGLAPYQKIISDLVAALEPATAAGGAAPAGADAGAAALPTLASTLSRTGTLTLNTLTGADKDRLAQVSGWLAGANVERDLQGPFLAPVQAVYSLGTSDINRAIGQAWSSELSPLIAPLLARFPFRVGARDDVQVADLEAVLRAQGKQPGTFWTAVGRWLGPVTVQRGNRYQWIGGGVSGPAGALATINDLARLSRALWDADGNPTPLPIKITPQPLDSSPVAGRVPTLAYLRSGSSAVYAFNQRPGASTLALQWWEQGISSMIIEMRKPGTTDGVTYSIDESESPFSFFRLLCRARAPNPQRPQDPGRTCVAGTGRRVWDIPLDRVSTRSVTLTLDADPWALFQIGR